MRVPVRFLLVVTAAFMALPHSAASAEELPFSRTPVGGPRDTRITVSGHCDQTRGEATLAPQVRSDAVLVGEQVPFTVGPDNKFTTEIVSPYAPNGRDDDLQVTVRCGQRFGRQPFTAADAVSTASPTVFTALGRRPCGNNFSPVGTDSRIACRVQVKGFAPGGALTSTNFFVEDWFGGSSVAVGDTDGDDRPDIVSGSGPGRPTQVVVANLAGQAKAGIINAYPGFDGGISVAVGDLHVDGFDDVVLGAGPGGGPHVKVFARNPQFGSLLERLGFFAYDPSFRGGVSVATVDIDGDGASEIVTGAGPGGGPHVRVFHRDGHEITGFFAYAASFTGGVSVAGADLDGDGREEIITGAGPGGGPHVRMFSGDGTPRGSGFYAYAPEFTSGVYVGAGQAIPGGGREIVTGPGEGGNPHVRIFDATGATIGGGFFAYGLFPAGTQVAVAR